MVATVPPEDAVRRFLHSLRKPARLLVAVSGGSDSCGLLILLHRILSEGSLPNVSLVAATVDHGLRPEAAREAEQVASFCRTLAVPHTIRRWTGEKPPTGISAAAREARHALLADAAAETQADAIVTGHTLDDQIETVAMRAARSRSDEDPGLAGMAEATLYDRRVWFLRPLLPCLRKDIRAVLRDERIGWIDDPSNDDPRYERARIRQTLAGVSAATSDRQAAERRQRLSIAAAALVADHAACHAATVFHVRGEALGLAPDVVRHALAALLAVAGGRTHTPGREVMDHVTAFVAETRAGRMTAARSLLVRRRDDLFILRERRDIMSLTVPAGTALPWDGRFLVHNRGDRAVVVEAGADAPPAGTLDELPPALQRHALSVLPRLVAGRRTLSGGYDFDQVAIEPVLAPYDLFLPRFDLELADAIARLTGRKSYLTPPV